MKETIPTSPAEEFPAITIDITEEQRDTFLGSGLLSKKIYTVTNFVIPGDRVTLKLPDGSKLLGELMKSEPSDDEKDCVVNTYRLVE